MNLTVDTLGHLLALHVTPVNDQDRRDVAQLVTAVQEGTGETITVARVDQGYTGAVPLAAAAAQGIALEVVKLPAAKRDFGYMSRFRRLASDQDRLTEVFKGSPLLAFTMLMWNQALPISGVL